MSKNVLPVRVFKIITLALGEVGETVGHFYPCTQEVHHYYFTYLTLIRHFQRALVHTGDNWSQWHLYFTHVVIFQVQFCWGFFLEVSTHYDTYHALSIKLFDQLPVLVKICISSVYKYIEILECLACLNETDYKGLQYYLRTFRTPDRHKSEQCQER